ncbi:phosphoesterase, partial [Streptomyces triticagri]
MDTPDIGIPEQLARRLSMPEQHEYLRDRHARPKVSRRSALAGGLVTAAAAGGAGLLIGGADSAGAAGPGAAPAAAG